MHWRAQQHRFVRDIGGRQAISKESAGWWKTSAGSAEAKIARSHVLLHCPNERLRAAIAEAWEGKNYGGVRVLLANPRWERQFVKFLELSGVGRAVADGTDEDAARAAKMDEWVVWETVERAAPRGEG
jgi:hypothetical protein